MSVGEADDSEVGSVVSGHSDEDGDCVDFSFDEAAGVVDRVYPETELFDWNFLL